MRLFIALDIDDAIRERIARFMDGVRGFAPDARWMHPESLHVTLKFIGEQPESAVDPIKHALAEHPVRRCADSISRLRILPHREIRRAYSGLASKPDRNWRRWQRQSTTKWHPSEFRKKTAPSART